MSWEILLAATLEAGLGLIAEAGFGDAARQLRDRLLKTDEKKRLSALNNAWQAALTAADSLEFRELLEHRPFQEEVVSGLVDPIGGFDIQAAAHDWEERLPRHALALRRFFNALQNAILADEIWGPVLERYQELRYRQDVQQALAARGQPADDRSLVKQVSVQIFGDANTYLATATNGGVIAQGSDAIAVGTGGVVVQGNANGDIITGTKTVQHFHAPDPRQAAADEAERARRRYLERLRRNCQVLPLAALGGDEGKDEDITLDRVYIELDTATRVELTEQELQRREGKRPGLPQEDKTRPLPALEAAQNLPRLALLGDPGAGKSTFVRNLLAWQAAALLGETEAPEGISGDLLPVFILLRDLAPRLAGIEALSMPKQRQAVLKALKELILQDLEYLGAPLFAGSLLEALQDGRCLLALDGLDEVPGELRRGVRLAVAALLGEYQIQRVILTCRVRSYTGEAVLPDFQTHTLAPFSPEKVQQFARAWYRAQEELGRLNSTQAGERAGDLGHAALTGDLRELSSNPMMLTAMAIIHQKEIGLPNERVRLYSLVVDVLLRRWQKAKTGEGGLAPSPEMRDFLKDDLRLRRAMERLAYEAHKSRQGKDALSDLPRGLALTVLEAPEYLGQTGLAAEFLDYVDQRSGLLLGRGGEPGRPETYSFPHRTFQEYLAGCHMAGLRDYQREFYTRAGQGDAWALAAQLGAEELYYNRRNLKDVLDLAYRLCREPSGEQNQRALLWSGNISVLAGRQAIELDKEGDGPAYLKRLLPYLARLPASRLPAIERAEAGRVLGILGDPRPETSTLEEMQFCYIPAGKFLMGTIQPKIKNAYE